MNSPLLRFCDILFALTGLLISSPVLMILFIVGLVDTGSPIFRQVRAGQYQKPFTLVKFRTMKKDTVHVASHLANRDAITPYGHFLRRSKLDELPQLWNVLKGEMSLVGPRPCLFNQQKLIDARTSKRVYEVRPGITGLAQINNVDMSDPVRLAETDAQMIQQWHLTDYFRFILATVLGKGAGDRVR